MIERVCYRCPEEIVMKHLLLIVIVIGLCCSYLMGAQTGLREIPVNEIQAAFR